MRDSEDRPVITLAIVTAIALVVVAFVLVDRIDDLRERVHVLESKDAPQAQEQR